MSVERRDNDKQVEETKKQIEDVEKKVWFYLPLVCVADAMDV